MKATKYRIVTDQYLGYECQVWRWYWPFWIQLGGINTFHTIERAEHYINNNNRVVKTF